MCYHLSHMNPSTGVFIDWARKKAEFRSQSPRVEMMPLSSGMYNANDRAPRKRGVTHAQSAIPIRPGICSRNGGAPAACSMLRKGAHIARSKLVSASRFFVVLSKFNLVRPTRAKWYRRAHQHISTLRQSSSPSGNRGPAKIQLPLKFAPCLLDSSAVSTIGYSRHYVIT